MNYRNIDEPIFFTEPNQPLSYKGGRTLFKGGSSGREATEEEKRLWGAQATSLENLNAISMPTLTAGMNNLGTMANESMDGTLASRMRSMAGADASQAMSQGIQAASRNLGRYGSTMNPNALGATMAASGLEGARLKSNAMNMANTAAEDVKWQRNAALAGLASGQGAQSVSGMGSLAGQIGQNRTNANNLDAQTQGNATAGLMMGGKMMGLYKDGGIAKKGGRCFADGGLTMFRPTTVPKLAPYKFSGSKPQADGGMLETVANVATPAMGINMAANGLSKVGITAPKQAIDGLVTAGKNALGIGQPAAAQTGLAAMDGSAPIMAAEYAAPEIATAAADGAAAGSAAAAEGAAAAGAGGLGAAAMAAAPWLIGGYAIGSMLDLWKDGGDVRKDMTGGGKVAGPGTGTSDSVDAKLSDGEIVANTAAVGLGKSETQKVIEKWAERGKGAKDLLLAINDKGLEKRYGKDGAKANPRYEGAAQKLALGGIAQALGQGLYKAAPTLNQIDEQRKNDAYRQAQMGIIQAQDKRAQTMHDRQIGVMDQEAERDKAAMGVFKGFADGLSATGKAIADVEQGKMHPAQFVDANLENFNQYVPDGSYAFKGKDGNYMLAKDPSGKDAQPVAVGDLYKRMTSPESARFAQQNMLMQLASISPKYFDAANRALQSSYERQEKVGDETSRRTHEAEQDKARRDAEDKRHKAGLDAQWAGINLTKTRYDSEQKQAQDQAAALADMEDAKNAGDTSAYNAAKRRLILAGAKPDKDGHIKVDLKTDPLGGLYVAQTTSDGGTTITPVPQDSKGVVSVPPPGSNKPSPAPVTVQMPTGQKLTFPNQEAANAFKARVGIK